MINRREHEILKNGLEKQIAAVSSVALEKNWLTSKEIESAIQEDKEEIVYDPFENIEDSEPDY